VLVAAFVKKHGGTDKAWDALRAVIARSAK
jgi:hypothetical protein